MIRNEMLWIVQATFELFIVFISYTIGYVYSARIMMYYVVRLCVQNFRKVFDKDTKYKFIIFKRIWNTISKV